MSDQLKNDIISFMVDAYDNSSPKGIKEVEEEKMLLLIKINFLKVEI